MRLFDKQKKLAGQSLIEVILAVALIAIFASSLSVYLNNQLAYMTRGQNALEAIYLAQEGLEAARSIRDEGWEYLATGTHGLVYTGIWEFSGNEEKIGRFFRKIIVDSINENERSVQSLVEWPGLSATRTIMLATHLSNWREIIEPLLTGNWNNPQVIGTIDLGPGNTPTDLYVQDGIIYMSAQASSAAKPDLFIIDATTGTNPVIKSQIDTSSGLNGIAVSGDFAYLANQEASNPLLIANISDIQNPYIISSFRIAGNVSQALTVAATGSVIFVGTENDSSEEFYVINAETPTAPVVLNQFEIGANINDIIINKDKIYLATDKDDGEVFIFDIQNPGNPVIIAQIDAPGTNDAISAHLNFQNNQLFLAREVNGAANSPEIVIYDAADVYNPVLAGSMEFAGDVYYAYGADEYLLLASSYSSEEFQIYNNSDPSNLSYITGINFPQLAVDMELENNIVYMAIRSNDALRIITSQ